MKLFHKIPLFFERWLPLVCKQHIPSFCPGSWALVCGCQCGSRLKEADRLRNDGSRCDSMDGQRSHQSRVSSLSHPHQILFRQLISFSSDERDAIQKKTFTKWVNKHLKKVRNPKILIFCRHIGALYFLL